MKIMFEGELWELLDLFRMNGDLNVNAEVKLDKSKIETAISNFADYYKSKEKGDEPNGTTDI